MCTMIGQFSRLYLMVHPAKFKSLLELKSFLSIRIQKQNKYLTNLVFLISTVSYGPLFFFQEGTCPTYFPIGP